MIEKRREGGEWPISATDQRQQSLNQKNKRTNKKPDFFYFPRHIHMEGPQYPLPQPGEQHLSLRGGKVAKQLFWKCYQCGWHIYVPQPCPLCSGFCSLPPAAAVPSWWPQIQHQQPGRSKLHHKHKGEDALADDHQEDEDKEEKELILSSSGWQSDKKENKALLGWPSIPKGWTGQTTTNSVYILNVYREGQTTTNKVYIFLFWQLCV